MARWLGILLVLILAAPVDAQVFKPRGKKADVTEKKKKPKKAAAKKAGKKKAATKARKSAAADREDSEPEARSKKADPDFVKITDDEDIE